MLNLIDDNFILLHTFIFKKTIDKYLFNEILDPLYIKDKMKMDNKIVTLFIY